MRSATRRLEMVVLALVLALVAGALALWTGRGEALLLDLAGGIRAVLCL